MATFAEPMATHSNLIDLKMAFFSKIYLLKTSQREMWVFALRWAGEATSHSTSLRCSLDATGHWECVPWCEVFKVCSWDILVIYYLLFSFRLSTFSYTSGIWVWSRPFVEICWIGVSLFSMKRVDFTVIIAQSCGPGRVPRLIQGYSQQVNLAACRK